MTDIDGSAIDRIASLAQEAAVVQQIDVNGVKFTDKHLNRVDGDPRLPQPRVFYTLAGFADYLKAETISPSPLIHVVSPHLVEAVSPLLGGDKHLRAVYAQASYKPVTTFHFGHFDSLDQLAIGLQTCFDQKAGGIVNLRKFCGSVRGSSERVTADDGVSQMVQAKSGIAAVQDAPVNNPWELAPYRTFPEVEQPTSYYVLRFDQGTDMEAALFPTGDQSWEVEAVSSIATKLRSLLPQLLVMG